MLVTLLTLRQNHPLHTAMNVSVIIVFYMIITVIFDVDQARVSFHPIPTHNNPLKLNQSKMIISKIRNIQLSQK